MDKFFPKLIRVYGRNRIEDVRKNPALLEQEFGKSTTELAQEWDFPNAQEFVERQKRPLEAKANDFAGRTRARRIALALRLMLEKMMYAKSDAADLQKHLEIMRDLVIEMFQANDGWTAEQTAHFQFIYERLKSWNSYFLSYTNRDAKILNEKFKKIIELYVPPETRKQRDVDRDNLLADALVSQLRSQLLRRGFYDKDKIETGDMLRKTIMPVAGGTFSFVQLVQLETFDALSARNWCFEEYEAFHEHDVGERAKAARYASFYDKRFKAILTDDTRDGLLPPLPPTDYADWITLIFDETRHAKFPTTAEAFRAEVRKLAAQIINLKFQFIEHVPE